MAYLCFMAGTERLSPQQFRAMMASGELQVGRKGKIVASPKAFASPAPKVSPQKTAKPKRGKFGNIKTSDPEGGKAYDSRLEAKHGAEYQAMLERGEIRKLERQKVFTLHAGIKYIADFLITHLDGSLEAVDSKGMETAIFKLKKKLFLVDFPAVKLTIRKAAKAGKRTKAANKR